MEYNKVSSIKKSLVYFSYTVFRISSVEVGPPVVVDIVVTLRWSKSHVVVARGSIASEVSGRLLHKGLVYELDGLLALHL